MSFGYFMRMVPVINHPAADLKSDQAFNFRMVRDVVTSGSVPIVDKLSIYPIGKRIHEVLPVLFYYVVAAFHFIAILLFGPASLHTNVLRFSAFCGAAIAIPVYLASFAITKRRFVAALAAFISVIFPIGIARTFCVYFRFELLGTWLIMMAFAFVLRTLCSADTRRIFINSIAASLFMVLGVATWRMTLLFYAVLAIIFLVIFILHKDIRSAGICFGVMYLGYLASCVLITYMRASSYIFSAQTTIMTIVMVAGGFTIFVSERLKRDFHIKWRVIFVISALLIILLVSMALERNIYMKNSISMMKLAIAHKTGVTSILGPNELLFENTSELMPLKLYRVTSEGVFSASILLILLYLFMISADFIKSMERQEDFVLFASWTIFAVLTVLVVIRMQALWAPLSAIAMGAGIGKLYDKYGLDGSDPIISAKKYLIWSSVVLILALTPIGSFKMMMGLKDSLVYEQEFKDILARLKQNTPKDSVIWTHWVYNYPIQTYSDRATVTDALFEVEEIRDRVLEESRVLSGDSEEDLMKFINKYNISYLVVSLKNLPYPFQYAGLNFSDYFSKGKITEKGKSSIMIRMCCDPNSFKHIKLLFKRKEFSVFYVPGTAVEPVKNDVAP
jgi:hypothetical protein